MCPGLCVLLGGCCVLLDVSYLAGAVSSLLCRELCVLLGGCCVLNICALLG